MRRLAAVLLAFAANIPSAWADTLITTGMQPWETCAECHNLDGISAMARFPKLAGQKLGYLARQVRDIRDGRRRNDGGQMTATAAEFDDESLMRSAAYRNRLGGVAARRRALSRRRCGPGHREMRLVS